MAGARFSNSRIDVSAGGRVIGLEFEAASDAGNVELYRSTPADTTFCNLQLGGQRRATVQGQMSIPIASASELGVNPICSAKRRLSLPDYRFEIDDLDGLGTFNLPHQLEGDFAGQLFGNRHRLP